MMDNVDGVAVRVWWSGWTRNAFTASAILLIFMCQLARSCSSLFRRRPSSSSPSAATIPRPPPSRNFKGNPNATVFPSSASSGQPPQRFSDVVSDSDLRDLVDDLNEKVDEGEDWESVIDRSTNLFSYRAKRFKPKDGPMIYLSTTVFENCSSMLLKNFYMDNNYRKTWDRTLMEHEQLHVDANSGIEIGRTIKRFPFLTPREYVLAWKVWEDKDGAFYCISKGCEHPLAPRQKKNVRVIFHRSGWRIRKVAGRNACEIKMVHQEDAGLNVEMAKLAFAKGIWSYVCRMNDALRMYSLQITPLFTPSLSKTMPIRKFPPGLEATGELLDPGSAANTICRQLASESRIGKSSKMTSDKFMKNGLILLGGAICLSRAHCDLGAKVAMAYILTKLSKRSALSRLSKAGKA